MDTNINLILATDLTYGLGIDNDLLYQFSSDLKRFKELTSGKIVVMGRKTWESLPFKLPKRKNIVITKQKTIEGKQPDVLTSDIESILDMSKDEEIWVIGGSQIYEIFLPYTKKIEMTRVMTTREFDTNVLFLADNLLDFDISNIDNSKELDKVKNEELNISYITYERV